MHLPCEAYWKNLNFLRSFEKKIEFLKWSEMVLHRERALKGCFLLTSFSSLAQYRNRNSKKINFSKKNLKNLKL